MDDHDLLGDSADGTDHEHSHEAFGWRYDNVEFLSVGIDIGSSTSHLMFGRVRLQRMAQTLSSRFVVVSRETVWRSDVLLTPYRPDDLIDADALGVFIDRCYAEAGMVPEQVDTGVVILTGEALKRRNAERIASLFAESSGRFVCALAGHHREAVMAARGSGAAAMSRRQDGPVLNIDVGGGTTKFALLDRGEIRSTAAVAVGGRLLVVDDDRRITAVAEPLQLVARHTGIDLRVGEPFDLATERALTEAMVDVLVEHAGGAVRSSLAEALLLTTPLDGEAGGSRQPIALTFSGGVAEYVYGRHTGAYGDLGPSLGLALRQAVDQGRIPGRLLEPPHGIRATVVGLSQFSVQVTGNTLSVANEDLLPLRNVPVAQPPLRYDDGPDAGEVAERLRAAVAQLDLEDGSPVGLAVQWQGDPEYRRLLVLARAVALATAGLDSRAPVVVILDADLAASLGAVLLEEVGCSRPVFCLDGITVEGCDFVDIGNVLQPGRVIPVAVKSLLFATAGRDELAAVTTTADSGGGD